MTFEQASGHIRISVLLLLGQKPEEDRRTYELLLSQRVFGEPLQIIVGSTGQEESYFRGDAKEADRFLYLPGMSGCEVYRAFLQYAKGELLTVADGGDTFSEHYFEQVARSYVSREEPPALVMTKKGFYFRGIRYSTPFVTVHVKEDVSVIDLDERGDCALVPLFFGGTFLQTELARQYLPRPELTWEAEKEMFLRITLDHRQFLYLKQPEYRYSRAQDGHYIIFQGAFSREWYYESFVEFLAPFLESVRERFGQIPRYLQYVTVYCVMSRFLANRDNRNKHVIGEDGETYLKSLHTVLTYVDTDVLANRHRCPTYASSIPMRLLLYRIRTDCYYRPLPFTYHQEGKRLVAELDGTPFFSTDDIDLNIQFIEYRGGRWEIDCIALDLIPLTDAVYGIHFQGKDYGMRLEERFSLTRLFGCSVYKKLAFHASVPLQIGKEAQKLSFYLRMGAEEILLKPIFYYTTSRISDRAKYSYWRFDKYIAYRSGREIVIRRAKKLYTMYRELKIWQEWAKNREKDAHEFVKLRFLYFLARPYFKHKRIWMFLDKIYKGGDSAEYLYKFAMRQKDGVKKYYLLDEQAADYRRLKKEGYVPLKRDSLMHRLVFLNADMVIASNSMIFAANNYLEDRAAYIKDLTRFHVACVQHGLSVQNIARAQNRLKDNTRLYFCASRYEIQNLSRPIYNYAGYDALYLTGVPRYDGLVDEHKKQILLSPTWRMQSAIGVTTNEGVARDYNPYFKETPYYQVYNSLINDERLIAAARRYGYRIVYVLHPIVSPQAEDFEKNDYVKIVPSIGDMSYEKLFRESSLMVTDYSGVQFDFAYMRKPVVYLHHDAIPKHYEEGVFTYDTMAFGEICRSNEELIDVLTAYMRDGCQMKEMYVKRADDFFAFRDHNNCQRIYDVMIDYQHRVVDKMR